MAATDVASTVYEVRTHSEGVPIASTPISDQMFDMIIGGTPETSFISDYMKKRETKAAKRADETSKDEKEVIPSCVSSLIQTDEGKEKQMPSITEENKERKPPQENELTDKQKDVLEGSIISSDNEKFYMRERSIDSSRSIIEAAPEYNRLFSDLEGLGGFPSVPGLVVPDLDLDLSPSTSTPSEEISYEVCNRF